MEDWAGALAELADVESFNNLALALARERKTRNKFDTGPAKLVVAEAERRGYTWQGSKDDGFYIDLTPDDQAIVFAELERRERRECSKRMRKLMRKTKIPQVQAAFEPWVYKSNAEEELGALMVLDFRKRVGNQYVYEFDEVPERLYKRLFERDAADAWKQIQTVFAGQQLGELREWRKAI